MSAAQQPPPRSWLSPRLLPRLQWALISAHVLTWLKFLPGSFWLDECGTAWLVQGGPVDAVRRSLLLLHAPLFALIAAAASAMGGPTEVALRIPSWLAAGLSIVLFYKLASELFPEPAPAGAATGVFTLWPLLSYSAADARPYALAMAAVCALYLFFLRAVRRSAVSDFVALSLSAAAVVYLQLLFAYVLAFPAAFLAFSARDSLRRSLSRWLLSGLAVLVLLLPLVPFYKVMFSWGAAYSFAASSAPAFLLATLAPLRPFYFYGVLLIPAVPFIQGIRLDFPPPDRRALAFAALVVAIPVAAVVFASTLTGASLYVPRYLTPAVPGVALLAGWLLGRINPPHVAAWITVGALAATLGVQWGIADWTHEPEDWRGALARASALSAAGKTPIVLYSGFVESGSLRSLRSPEQRSYLLAPVAAYPVATANVVPLPFKPDPPSLKFWQEEFQRSVEGAPAFTVVARGMFFYQDWRQYLNRFAPANCYQLAAEEHFGTGPRVELAHFVRRPNCRPDGPPNPPIPQ